MLAQSKLSDMESILQTGFLFSVYLTLTFVYESMWWYIKLILILTYFGWGYVDYTLKISHRDELQNLPGKIKKNNINTL